MERGWRHEWLMILGAGTSGNWTDGANQLRGRGQAF
jgi:hypothetical protein